MQFAPAAKAAFDSIRRVPVYVRVPLVYGGVHSVYLPLAGSGLHASFDENESTVKTDTVTSSRIAQADAGKTVLVVDDEAGIRDLTREILERAGLRVIEAGDGIQALRLLETIKPDLLLTDIRMPGMDGIALAQEMGRRSPGLPVLLMSGFATSASRTALAKAEGVIQKPFSPNTLVRIVIRTLRQRRA